MFQGLLTRIANEFKRQRIPYMVIGGQAVLLYGEPRLTKDIDITLGMGTEGLKKLRGVTRKLGLRTLVDNPAEFVSKTMVLPVMYDKTGIRVNFIFSFSLYEKQAIERAVDVTFGRSVVKFAALEDVVIHKIIAGRARDLEDVKCILLKNRRYDKGYIRKWLGEFDESLKEDFSRTFRKILRQTQ